MSKRWKGVTCFATQRGKERCSRCYQTKCALMIMIIGGEAVEVMNREYTPIGAGHVSRLPSGVKHATNNKFGNDLRFLELYNRPPVVTESVEVVI